jgi:FHA domain-containing protein
MPLSIDELEKRLQSLIEINLLSILPGQKAQTLIVHQLANAIKTTAGSVADHAAPDVYTLVVHPDSAANWSHDPNLLEGLAKVLRTVADETGLHLVDTPTISIATDPSLDRDGLRVMASHRMEKVIDTQAMQPEEAAQSDMPKNAFLIIGGIKVFQLDKSVINIGRRADNHLVLDDPRISRYHAQIRATKGRFVLFDLNSTGGTYVNGQRINQTVLYPGDVISLAGLPIIFGQDNPPPFARAGDTGPISISASERATAILRNTSELPPDENKKP